MRSLSASNQFRSHPAHSKIRDESGNQRLSLTLHLYSSLNSHARTDQKLQDLWWSTQQVQARGMFAHQISHTREALSVHNYNYNGIPRRLSCTFHQASSLGGLETQFYVFIPQRNEGKAPVLYFLAGMTCNEDTG